MAEYRRGAHTVFEIHLHLVWITKYRRPALQGEVATRVRDLIRDICGQHELSIMKGHVSKDHVHLLISLPPQVTISRLMQWLKGRTAHHLLAEFPHLKKQFWGRHLWARGYFCCSSGNGRRHRKIHRRAEYRSGRGLQSRWLKSIYFLKPAWCG